MKLRASVVEDRLLIAVLVLVLPLASALSARAQGILSFAGNGGTASAQLGDGGPARDARVNRPLDVALASDGGLFIADYGDENDDTDNHRIRHVNASGVITTVAGNGTAGNAGDGGPATAANLNGPIAVAVDTVGAGAGDVYIADYYNNRVRRVLAANGRIENFAGSALGTSGFGGDGLQATADGVLLSRPVGLAIDSAGNVFIADQGNHAIRRVDSAGNITTVAGMPPNSGFNGDGLATSTLLTSPYGLTFDLAGNLVICDSGNFRVVRLNSTNGMIETIVGSGLSSPRDAAFDASGNLYITDVGAQRVWRFDAGSQQLSTVVGNGQAGFSGDVPPPTGGSRLNNPSGLVVGTSGELYFADALNLRVRRVVDPQGQVDDDDGDSVNDVVDNCPVIANPDQIDFDTDGFGDLCDVCETIPNTGHMDPVTQLPRDLDAVDNACDTCINQWNPQVAGVPTANRTFVSHQRDDDADGRGNACDFDYDNAGLVITSGDFNQIKASIGKLMTASNCGAAPTNTQRCGEFDHDGLGAVVGATDFNLCKSAVGRVINTDFPKCSACSEGPGWSDVLGSAGARTGRPVCQSEVGGACTYAP